MICTLQQILRLHRFLLFLVVFCASCISRVSLGDTIKTAFFELKPHSYRENIVKGAANLHFEQVAKKMGHEIEWVGPLPFPRMLRACRLGEIDSATIIVENPKWRADLFFYSDKPIFASQPVLVTKKENHLNNISNIEDISGYRIGFLSGVAPSSFLAKHLDQFTLDKISSTEWFKQNAAKLMLDRIDAFHVLNLYTPEYYIKTFKKERELKILELPEPAVNTYAGFCKASSKGKLFQEQYNAARKEMELNYDELIELNSAIP